MLLEHERAMADATVVLILGPAAVAAVTTIAVYVLRKRSAGKRKGL
jgi:asparagine N-glycosylation enzyme membrane subunit Stt3